MFVSSIAAVPARPFILIIGLLALAGCGPEPAPVAPMGPPTFVGSTACSTCHEAEYAAWQDSHHALAMQEADASTVSGDFSGATLRHFGIESTFFVQGENYFVRTDGADGSLQDFPIRYVFGVEPLEQYLVEFPGGRLQALPLAWDSRPAEEGGQRWFHLYPDQEIPGSDPLHWTGREQNWNYQCAECHSTNLEKGYDASADVYATTWSEINVGCEGCHGPASRHVARAEAGEISGSAGLVTDLDDAGRATWQMNPDTGIAVRSEVRLRPPQQPESCGRCHARRSVASEDYRWGSSLMETHLPSLLEERLYHADGQILEEVYVYGSFLQSRMYQAGVSCTDCHDPHAARLKTGGEPSNICSTCHLPSRFDTSEHHQHPQEAVACVDCHMASRNYMVVDGRRDHSFRVPRPDVSLATGAPNACNDCHDDRDAAWANEAVNEWFGTERDAHYGTAIHAGRTGGGNGPLVAALGNTEFPGIARGTMLTLLRPPYSQEVARAIQASLGNSDPFVRLGALRALPGLQPELQIEWASPLLADRLRTIRVEAATVISPFRDMLHVRYEGAFREAEQELFASMAAVAERPEARINLGNLYVERGETGRGEAALLQAMQIDPGSVAARINLSDLYRRLGREAEGAALLEEGIETSPGEAAYHHALGLSLVRSGQSDLGLESLREAADLDRENPRYAYVFAVALNSLGQGEAAVAYLEEVINEFPGDFDLQWTLATILRDQQRIDEARTVATALAEIYPGVPPLENFLRSL